MKTSEKKMSDKGICNVCGCAVEFPFRRYDENGNIIDGCVALSHTGHLSNQQDIAWHTSETALLQKLWDDNKMMQDVLLSIGRGLHERQTICSATKEYMTDKALLAAKNLPDHDRICDMLKHKGVEL